MEKQKSAFRNKLFKSLLLAGVVIPLDQESWVKTNFPFRFAPDYEFIKQGIQIESDDDLGGYAYKLSRPIELSQKTKVRIEWNVKKYPNVTPRKPFVKKQDDYPVRVGLILSGGVKAKIPSSVTKRLPFKQDISNIVYYGPAKSKEKKELQCGNSPHNDYAVYCAILAPEGENKVEDQPLIRLQEVKSLNYPTKLLGIWIFADTDDSESESKVLLKKIEIVN